MQTVIGSNGQIGYELAKELNQTYGKQLRLVSRNPKSINDTDELISADILDREATIRAVAGSEIVYFAAGLPMDSEQWKTKFEIMLENVIQACKETKAKLVFFDNTYMYEKNDTEQFEDSKFIYYGIKSTVRAKMADPLVTEMENPDIDVMICRAPEFYGPNKTQSITNSLLFNRVKDDKTALVPISDQTLRTLIWTPDASKAMALLANHPDTYNQTWHLPCDVSRTYEEMIKLMEEKLCKPVKYKVIKQWMFDLGSIFNKNMQELKELLPRYHYDNKFNSDKFKKKFPDFEITTFSNALDELFKLEK